MTEPIPKTSEELEQVKTELAKEVYDLLPESFLQRLAETHERTQKAAAEAKEAVEGFIKERGDVTPDESE